jgi:hypothetical protein
MSRDAEQAYIRRWADTGRLLDEIRWRELRELDAAVALKATDDLIELALRVPLPSDRRAWSGLVDLQDRLHARSGR